MFKSAGRYLLLFTGLLILVAMPFQVSAEELGDETSDAKALQDRLEIVTELPKQDSLVGEQETKDSKNRTIPGGGVIFQGVTTQCWVAGTCSICDMLVVVVNITSVILRVFAIVGVMMLVYGAAFITLSSGNSQRVERGKNIMKAAIIGGIIVLGSWQFMTTLVWALYNTSVEKQAQLPFRDGFNPVLAWDRVVSSCRSQLSGGATVTSGPPVTEGEAKPVRVPR